ncbi:MAG: 3-isopropylmalate dehydrogenase [Rikenellaceae bacterium]
MKKEFNIALLAGDGIGPEVVLEGVKVLDAVATRFGLTFNYTSALVGASAIDSCGDPFPKATEEVCLASDAILFGAVGDPKYDNDPTATVRPEQGLLRMRQVLGLYANVRPLVMFDCLIDRSPLKEDRISGADCVFIRELTGGIYFGEKHLSSDGTLASDLCVYRDFEVERVLRYAFEVARTRRSHLTVVDKANVLETSRLWRRVAQSLAPSYSDVTVEYMFVDNAAMQLVQRPTQFDVVVTENMFGDILTDEMSVISGSMGLMPSASVGSAVALFEPIHGSYPQATGLGIANPVATILSCAMLLEHLGLSDAGACVRSSVQASIENGFVTEDLCSGGEKYSTSQVGDYVADMILG